MNMRLFFYSVSSSLLFSLLPVSISFSAESVSDLISNPFFRDEDGDGSIEGWEVKTFILEKDRQDPRKQRLSLKIQQDSDRQITGEVSTVFQGADGYHQITIRYLDESDGISLAKLLVNGKVVHMWDFDNVFFDYYRNEVIENVFLARGDRITIWAANNFTEYCRLDSVRVIPSPRPPSAQEIEMMSPPSVTDVSFGHLVALREVRDPAAGDMRPESSIKASRASVLFPAQAGQKVALELFPNNTRSTTIPKGVLRFLGETATGLEDGTSAPVELEFPYDPETASGIASFTAPSTGLYRLDVRGVTPSLKIPHVLSCPPGTRNPLLVADGDFYCFVPKGTSAFAVTASATGNRTTEVMILTPDGSLCKRTCIEPREELAVRVPGGQDDGVWLVSVRGISPHLALRGIPPFMATHPDYLLIPRDCVTPRKP